VKVRIAIYRLSELWRCRGAIPPNNACPALESARSGRREFTGWNAANWTSASWGLTKRPEGVADLHETRKYLIHKTAAACEHGIRVGLRPSAEGSSEGGRIDTDPDRAWGAGDRVLSGPF
jgi:hypothetical protein